jgi:hypothetical protein
MGQRKLTDEELQKVLDGRNCLRKVLEFSKHVHYIGVALEQLDAIAIHCTTDGKPYVESQPEIGDGYRPVTEADRTRQDAEFWSQTGGGWQRRKVLIGKPLSKEYHYRVPIDRIPTDEDAKQRPTVMVCGNAADGWHARPLLAVTAMGFLVASGDGFTNWKNARFPYLGELD